MERRNFLRLGGLAALGCSPLVQAAAQLAATTEDAADPRRRLLVLIELNGGNDGLNTVVPYADGRYYTLRPNIGVHRDQVLQLDEHVGLHPALQPLMPVFSAGEMAIVQGVGYPAFNRSHFRSIDIWDTASDADEVLTQGWLTRAAAIETQPGFAAPAVVIGRNPNPVSGSALQPVVMANAASFVADSEGVRAIQTQTHSAALRHILRVQAEIESAGRGLAQRRPPPPGDFPKSPIGRDASEAARLLVGNAATPVIKIALGGFDNHVNLRATHDRLLGQLAAALAALRSSLLAAGVWDRTLVMTYSEFGRRAAENASRGADHGKGAPMLLLGGGLRGGLYGPTPELGKLDDGDLACAIDFRSVYNDVLGGWWRLREQMIAPARHAPLGLVA